MPLLWWSRIVVRDKRVHGWTLLRSRLIGQNLETVWLAPWSTASRSGITGSIADGQSDWNWETWSRSAPQTVRAQTGLQPVIPECAHEKRPASDRTSTTLTIALEFSVGSVEDSALAACFTASGPDM